jgi:guanosine-3',5'-bis(diphosphate) 3'-pyrophosphohydrolase
MNSYWLDFDIFIDWNYHHIFLRNHFKNESLDKLEHAISFVEKYHDEPRMDGTGNMKVHLLRVARILLEEMNIVDIDVILIGLLHDILEDTPVSYDDLINVSGEKIANGVSLLTRPREKDWKEYANEVVLSGDMNVIKLKIADKLDNFRSHRFSPFKEKREKDYVKTTEIMLPIVRDVYPEIESKFQEIITIW